jgi:F-type H+-transporting ATPase subunit delta
MPNPRLATRYAKALLDLSIEQGNLEEVFSDMQWLDAVCKSNRDFTNLLRSPIVKEQTKIKVIDAVVDDKIGFLTKAFIKLLVAKNREANLDEIATAFTDQYRKYKNIQIVKLTTAAPVSDTLKSTILAQLKIDGLQNIQLEEKVNPDLIGGFVLEVGDKMIDTSIAYELKAIAKQFKNNDFVYRVR